MFEGNSYAKEETCRACNTFRVVIREKKTMIVAVQSTVWDWGTTTVWISERSYKTNT